jgi:uncharacterized DUF497 family protein
MVDFEWDTDKAQANYHKHGVSFETATKAFGDPFAVETIDPLSPDYGEERIRMVGRADQWLLVVVYTERGDRIRLISARRAIKTEHDDYYRQNTQD